VKHLFAQGLPSDATHPLRLAASLVLAALLGWLVAEIHRRTHRGSALPSFAAALVLLTVLIAAVTQVIGDNVARAFSLVGALSIVRFRTVVQDTRDIAFVILAVTIGMALGSGDLWVAGLTLVVAGGTAALLAGRRGVNVARETTYSLSVQVGLGRRADDVVAPVFGRLIAHSTVVSVGTANRGASLESVYEVHLLPNVSPGEVVDELNGLEGVQSVGLRRRDGV
jgi:hypothetical protein